MPRLSLVHKESVYLLFVLTKSKRDIWIKESNERLMKRFRKLFIYLKAFTRNSCPHPGTSNLNSTSFTISLPDTNIELGPTIVGPESLRKKQLCFAWSTPVVVTSCTTVFVSYFDCTVSKLKNFFCNAISCCCILTVVHTSLDIYQ